VIDFVGPVRRALRGPRRPDGPRARRHPRRHRRVQLNDCFVVNQ